eukprot:TRINITY_DN82943_c0_g1_i1.p1 TRINITY_DN82943_c0_g1~~TRINITY_DN82943_c0_g1_i1.p1  ORF type:complete len:346 (+),score=72.45 TRINITY_DN82943_c0_g1_i1:28-1065(+)
MLMEQDLALNSTEVFYVLGKAAVLATVILWTLRLLNSRRNAKSAKRVSERICSSEYTLGHDPAETDEEVRALQRLQEELRGEAEEPHDTMLMQVAWARSLDTQAAAALWRRHLEAAQRLRVADVDDESVREAYCAGFCVRAGSDIAGRPIIWVRLKLSVLSGMTPALVVRNTWLAQDAILASSREANRRGICFVYDLQGVGLKNVTFDPQMLSAALWGATSHPSHISRVCLLDAPRVFSLAWAAGKHFVPPEVRGLVQFLSTGSRDTPESFAHICRPSELPVYLGGDSRRFGQPFAEWMFEQLQGRPLAYRKAAPRLPVPSRKYVGGTRRSSCFAGACRLLPCTR